MTSSSQTCRRCTDAPRWALFVAISVAAALAAPSAVLHGQADSWSLINAHRQILRTARDADPALRAARARLAAARASAAAAGPTPVTSLGADLSDGLGGNITTGNLTIAASREILGNARRSAARDLASVEVEIARREYEAHERALPLEIANELATAVGATRVLQRIDAADDWLEDAESALASRFAIGEARYLDVLRVRTERLELSADRADAVAERVAALAALRARVGPSASAEAVAAVVDRAARDTDLESWLVLLGERPPSDSLLMWSDAVRAARGDERRASAQRALQLAEQGRHWNGLAGLQRIGPDNGGPSMGIVLGLSTTLPFTARRAATALGVAADSAVMAAEETRVAAESRVTAQLDANVARDDAAQQRLRLLSAALGGATTLERDAALVHYRNGDISLLELLDFERALLRVEVERARALAAAAAARVALFGFDL